MKKSSYISDPRTLCLLHHIVPPIFWISYYYISFIFHCYTEVLLHKGLKKTADSLQTKICFCIKRFSESDIKLITCAKQWVHDEPHNKWNVSVIFIPRSHVSGTEIFVLWHWVWQPIAENEFHHFLIFSEIAKIIFISNWNSISSSISMK